ncbi:transcription factor SPT20 homolog isoform X2 [Cylas formicarius]|uniref:transcription factor SPT20 homolog isoform X2 n=1 Tax=Cylas formicarius TaxID=197179 RepID=UPI002958484A|nr:transcription factor SPT20 homolog isoform X2 [Cylas formicarius]
MQSLEATCGESEHPVKKFKANHTSLTLSCPQDPQASTSTFAPFKECTEQPVFDLMGELEKLYDEEESDEEVNCQNNVRYHSLLLEKLVARERLNTVILNLYPSDKGYSLAFRLTSCSDRNSKDDHTANIIETKPRPYEEEDLLRYICNEALPPYILDILEQFSYLFYSGCIIAEVRDYRQAYPHNKCDIHHVLLRPTQQSILADINNMVDEKLTSDDRDQLESQLLLAHTPNLFLDPDPHIENELAEIHNRKRMWNTNKFRRIARKFSQVIVNRKRKLDHSTQNQGLEFLDFVNKVKRKPDASKKQISMLPIPELGCPSLRPPTESVFINKFEVYPWPKETSDCLPQLIEELVLEMIMPSKDKDRPRAKLSIFQRPLNAEYLGELYLDRDHKKNEHNGVACRFSLGSRSNANRYIHQFTEIYTASSSKPIRIVRVSAQNLKDRIAQQHIVSQPNLVINGTSAANISVIHQNAQTTTVVTNPEGSAQKINMINNQKIAISALAANFENSSEQFQATLNARQAAQQKQQNFHTVTTNTAVILNSDLNLSSVNAINNITVPQQRLLARKINFTNVGNTRILNHNNLITLNNNRVNMNTTHLTAQQPQSVTLTSVNSDNSLSMPVKQGIVGAPNDSLSALLVGTPAADRPDIIGSNTNSLFLEKFASVSNSGPPPMQSQKNNTVLAPLSSPPPQATNTINVQSLNLTQLQGLQNVQFQLQPISVALSVPSAGTLQRHPTGLLMSLPVTTTTQTSLSQACTSVSSHSIGNVGVVITNTGSPSLAQLLNSGVKNISHQNLRTTTIPQTALAPGNPQFQLMSQLQRTGHPNASISSRTIQRTPVTIKMANPNSNFTSQVTIPLNTTLQKPLIQDQQEENQSKNLPGLFEKVRRSHSFDNL